MKNLIKITVSFVILFLNTNNSDAQNDNGHYLGPDSDTLRSGNIYLVELKSKKEYLGEIVKIDSLNVLFKDYENELKKIKKSRIEKCLNIFTNNSFNKLSEYYWIINLKNDNYYDSISVRGSWIAKDTVRFRLLNNKYIKVPINKITGIEIYIDHHQDLEADPMNMFFPYMILSRSVKTDEFSFAGLSNKWKEAQFRYLIYKY